MGTMVVKEADLCLGGCRSKSTRCRWGVLSMAPLPGDSAWVAPCFLRWCVKGRGQISLYAVVRCGLLIYFYLLLPLPSRWRVDGYASCRRIRLWEKVGTSYAVQEHAHAYANTHTYYQPLGHLDLKDHTRVKSPRKVCIFVLKTNKKLIYGFIWIKH